MRIKFKKDVGAVVRRSGVSFRLWAPFAGGVAVTGSFNDWAEQPMDNEGDGYWAVFVRGAREGQEYKFVIKNGDATYARNDPRARHFTTAAGNSVIVANHFEWGEGNFVPALVERQVMYELHVGTFNRVDPSIAGTFETAMQRLDHLAALGVTTIELMPVSGMSMEREWWGYTPEYIYAVENLYGGRHQMMEFVRAAHDRGMAVVLDVVYNHFASVNTLDLWQFDGWHEDGKGGIYFYNDWRSSTPWGDTRPDYGRPEVQQFLLDNIRMWLYEFKVDGFRVDSTIFIRNAIGRNDDPGNDLAEGWELLQRINTLSRKINPDALTVGEDIGVNDYITKPVAVGGAGFAAQWEVDFPRAFREALATDKPEQINLTGICGYLTKRFNDDAFQRVIYTDSHDSAANGSARLNEILAPGKSDSLFAREQSLIAAAILFTTPGVPMLLQGQEFLEEGSFSDWQALDWEKQKRHAGILEAYKHLIALRKDMHGISAGLTGKDINLMHVDEDNKVIAYHRWKNGGPKDDVVVVVNFGNRQFQEYSLGFPRNGTWHPRFNSTWDGYSPDFKNVKVPEVTVQNGSGTLLLPPNSATILSQDR